MSEQHLPPGPFCEPDLDQQLTAFIACLAKPGIINPANLSESIKGTRKLFLLTTLAYI